MIIRLDRAKPHSVLPVVVMAVLGFASPASSQQRPEDLIQLSLEDLLKVEITSVSRRPQTLASAPAAIYVITAEDIRRSSATSLPELLRVVPGIQVARYSNSSWAISARGMGSYYSNKLLVLVDGRSVYTEDFSGVYWDLQDLPLEDIDRVEVIRGPGGTMWGANAVNGVINVITKPAAATTGTQATIGTGTDDRVITSLKYGDSLGVGTTYRVYGRVSDRAFEPTGDAQDTSRLARGGFRVDRSVGTSTFRLQGDTYTGHELSPINPPELTAPYAAVQQDSINLHGFNLLAQWTRTFSPTSSIDIGGYVDHNVRNEHIDDVQSDRYDVDFQHHLKVKARNEIVWGLEGRSTVSAIANSDVMAYLTERSRRVLVSAFGQDEITLHRNFLLTLGGKVERHETVGLAIEPNIRAIWSYRDRQSVWAAASQSARTPSLADQTATFRYLVLPPSAATRNLPVEIEVVGTPETELEHVTSYEVGYRFRPLAALAFDLTAFHNHYARLASYDRSAATFSLAGGIPHLLVQSIHTQRAAGESNGGEALATWTPFAWWTLSSASTFLNVKLHMTDPTADPGNSLVVLLYNPKVQFVERSAWQFGDFDLDATVLHMGALQAGGVSAYTRTDARVGWRVSRAFRTDAGVQNMFDRRHIETAPYLFQVPVSVGRELFVRLTWGQ